MNKQFLVLFFVMFLTSSVFAIKVGVVFDAGGKNDRSFNQSAWEGASKAAKDFGVTLKDVEPSDSSKVEEAIRTFAKAKYDLIIAIGFANGPAIKAVSKKFPNIHFAIVDSVVKNSNVSSLIFKEEEGSFLVGMIAAMRAKKVNKVKKVGFIGGMDIPLIHKFEQGFIQGVKTINPKIDVTVNYVGNTPSAWNDPTKAKEIATAQISSGVSVIYAAAGGSGNGLFDKVKEIAGDKGCSYQNQKCVYAIGVDSNQNYIAPGVILTSMLKRVDVAVYNTIKAVKNGTFKGGVRVFGLKENGVGYSLDKHNKKIISKKMIRTIEKYKKKIIDGKITIKNSR